MRTTIFPMRDFQIRPAFWGVERDLKDVMDSIENVWEGIETRNFSDFKETDQAFLLSVDMPGVKKEDLDIQVEGQNLMLRGSRKLPFVKSGEDKKEISRTIQIPKNVDTDKIHARLEDGVLYLALTKEEKAKPKKVEINVGTSNQNFEKLLGNEQAD